MKDTLKGKITPHHFWLGLFGLWMIFLSGVPSYFMGSVITAPGMLQAIQLQHLLNSKQKEIDNAENELIAMQEEATQLEKSKLTQEREIRRVLGYAAPNELIFDFSHGHSDL